MIVLKLILLTLPAILLSSCAIEAPEARKMTFAQAMEDLTKGMEVLRNNAPEPGKKRLGLVPTEVTATFELTKAANGELGVNLSAAPTGILSAAGLTTKNSQGVTRKNLVTVTMKNVFVDKDGAIRKIVEKDIPPSLIIPMSPSE